MFAPQLKVTAIVVASLLLFASGVWLSSGDSRLARADEAKDSKLKDLLKERLLILQEVASRRTKAHQDGQISLAQVYEANQAVRNAELDLCDTSQERVAVLEQMLAEAKGFEKNITLEMKSGGVSTNGALKAKLSRLDVEIALERAKGK